MNACRFIFIQFYFVCAFYDLENLGLVGMIKIKWILQKRDGMAWSGMISPRNGTCSGLLQIW